MNNPLVSIIIATYRRSTELDRAIESAVNQTYDNIEIIVVDDNDDITWNERVKKIYKKREDKRHSLLIQNHPNKGSAKTRNIGINNSKGEYIVFLDDDDVFLPQRVENQVADIIADKGDYGITDIVLYNEDESINEIRKRWYLLSDEGKNLLLCHLKYHMTGTDTLIFRKEYIDSFGGFDPIDSGDEYYLMMKAINKGGKITYTPKSDIKAYVHLGDGGLSSGAGKIEGEKKLFDYKKKFFDEIEFKDRQYIIMRHYAVLAFAYLRMKKYIFFITYGFVSFLASPLGCIKMLKSRKIQ